MAAQPLPLADYLDLETTKKRPVHRASSRVQGSWEQFGAGVSPAPIRTEPPRYPDELRSVATQVMVEPQFNVGTSFVRNSSTVLAEIDRLAAGVEDEVRPTEFAYTRARSFVESAYGQVRLPGNVPDILPQVSITTDDVGGVRLAWRLGRKRLRANFGAANHLRSYLYFESGLDHHVEDLNVQCLAGGLAWLTKK